MTSSRSSRSPTTLHIVVVTAGVDPLAAIIVPA